MGSTRYPSTTAASFPTGGIIEFGGTVAPTGWLFCDGSSVLRGTYSDLFAAIGTAFGAADGTHFNLPDRRGLFGRGTDNMGTAAGAAGNDPDTASRTAQNTGGNTGNAVGSVQGDTLQGHAHSFAPPTSFTITAPASGNGTAANGTNAIAAFSIGGPVSDGTNGTPRAGPETRPKNVYLNYIIKT